ncbi:MAG: MmcQ/YjbR family DNA-binding protein [Rhizobacter sp.]
MKFSTVRTFALSLPEVSEAPHHDFGSFRVTGKIFVTVPPGETHLHVFVDDDQRERALVVYPAWTEKLLWGGKVVGLRVELAKADAAAVKRLVRAAWERKAPKRLVAGAKETRST